MDEADSQPQAETPVVPQRSTPPPPRTTTPQPPNHALSLSLPVHNTPPAKTAPKTANGSSGDRAPGHGRDDCWSEGATNTLIEAWGTRYLELNRGNLKQKHWKDVADAVSNRENGIKPPKTDVQCKNRLDTLKKKYKLEKNKMISSSGGGGSSKWAFFNKLDELIGPSRKHQQHPHHQPPPAPPMQKLPTPSPPMKAVPIKHRAHMDEVVVTNPQPSSHLHHHLQPMVMPVAVSLPVSAPMNLMIPNAHCHMPPHLHVTLPGPTAVAAPNSASSKSDETPDTTDSYPNGGAVNGGGGLKSSSFCKKRKREDTDTEESPLKDLTRAIMKFGEIYERVESSKMQQLIDLEKQRMVFLKDLEIQRMEYFMQAHVEMTKLKQERRHQQRSDEHQEHNNNNNKNNNGNHNDNTGKHIESPPERIATPNSNSNCCLSTNSVVVSETLRSSQFMLLL